MSKTKTTVRILELKEGTFVFSKAEYKEVVNGYLPYLSVSYIASKSDIALSLKGTEVNVEIG